MREWLSGGASPCQGEGRGFDPRLALLLCPKVARCLVYRKMYIVQRATFLCKERCGAPLEPMRSKGSGLPRLKSGSVGSAEKRSTGPFFESASPRLALLLCPKVARCLVYRKMYIVQRATFLCKERCGAPLEPMRSKGSGLPRLKSGSVGSAEKRSTGPFFVPTSPRLALLLCPKVVRYMLRIFLTTPQIMTRIRNTIFIQAGLGLRLLLPVRT